MMNRMPCEKKKQKPLTELYRSNKKRIYNALSVVGNRLINIAVIALFVLFYAGSVIYIFWPSSPSSHPLEKSESKSSTISSSESFIQNSKHNHIKIDSDQLDSEPVNACDSMVDAAPKAFIVDENSVTGCQDGILSAKRNGKNVEVYNMTEVREPGDTNNSSQEGITLSYCNQWCSLETLVKTAGGTLIDNPNGDGVLLRLSTGTYRFKVVYDDDAISHSVLVRTGKRM